MTEGQYRDAVASGETFLCDGVEYDFLALLPEPEESDQDDG